MKFYSYENRGETGAEKVLAMMNCGNNKFWGSFYTVA